MSANHTQTTQGPSNSILWIISAALLFVILLMIWLIITGGGRAALPVEQGTPVAGGAALPTEAPAAESELPPTAEPTVRPVFTQGSAVLAGGLALEGGQIRVHAEPSTYATTYGAFERGSAFTVMEPTGDFVDYPIEVDDTEWYRVRTEQGLVGWVDARFLDAAE